MISELMTDLTNHYQSDLCPLDICEAQINHDRLTLILNDNSVVRLTIEYYPPKD